MKRFNKSLLQRALKEQSGVALIWGAFMMVLMLGLGGLVFDVGHAYVCYRELQNSTDAACLAGAASLPNSTAATAATSFSAVSGNLNSYSNLPNVTMVSGYPKLWCLSSLTAVGMACIAPANANAIQVKQTVSVPTYFIRVLSAFGVNSAKNFTLTASATASMRGSARAPYNVAIIVDTTQSMSSSDSGSNCSGSRISCAMQGVQVLLSNLSPCMSNLTTCGTVTNGNVANAVDEVALFGYPGASTPANDYNCAGKSPGKVAYPDATNATYATLLTNYQILGLSSDYRASDTSTLSAGSNLTIAAGGKSGCTGMQVTGGEGTYFAGAVNTAQQYLVAQHTSRPTAQNVMIILSDGDASSGATFSAASNKLNANGTYPSKTDMCQQAVTMAQAATTAGTTVYTVGYGAASSGGCSSDSPKITPCATLQKMASSALTFFADTTSGCTSIARPTTTLNQIFTMIAGDMSKSRLIPDPPG